MKAIFWYFFGTVISFFGGDNLINLKDNWFVPWMNLDEWQMAGCCKCMTEWSYTASIGIISNIPRSTAFNYIMPLIWSVFLDHPRTHTRALSWQETSRSPSEPSSPSLSSSRLKKISSKFTNKLSKWSVTLLATDWGVSRNSQDVVEKLDAMTVVTSKKSSQVISLDAVEERINGMLLWRGYTIWIVVFNQTAHIWPVQKC